jgi:hypothetical protein
MVVGQFRGKTTGNRLPWKLQVEFSTQPGFQYGYGRRELPTEGDALLELAYAVTVHKAQGSEFGTTILVVPNPCRLLSRELIYTALTRQRDKVVVLHQGPLADLLSYSSGATSETARRLTNLLEDPRPKRVGDRWLEERLIHRTADGTLVRSKSEVLIADALTGEGVPWAYEKPFEGTDGRLRLPDFTIEDELSGQIYLWEHLGMLHDPGYSQAWDRKLAWYQAQGVARFEDGGGVRATLVVTKDDDRGGFDSASVHALIGKIWPRPDMGTR